MLGAGEALPHAQEELAEGGADHGWAGSNGATERAQQRPQVGAQRPCALLQHLGLSLRAVQPRAPAWAECGPSERVAVSGCTRLTGRDSQRYRREKATSGDRDTETTHGRAGRRKVDPGKKSYKHILADTTDLHLQPPAPRPPRTSPSHPTSLTSTLLGSSSTYFFSSNILSMMGPRMLCRYRIPATWGHREQHWSRLLATTPPWPPSHPVHHLPVVSTQDWPGT